MSLSSLSLFAYDASASPFLINHTINVPWNLYKPQVWSASSSPLYTNNSTENLAMILLSKKRTINHAMSKYFILVNSPCCYTLSTSYAKTSNSAFNNLSLAYLLKAEKK